MTWLNLLVSGTIFHFGIRHSVGADMISDFFQLLGYRLKAEQFELVDESFSNTSSSK